MAFLLLHIYGCSNIPPEVTRVSAAAHTPSLAYVATPYLSVANHPELNGSRGVVWDFAGELLLEEEDHALVTYVMNQSKTEVGRAVVQTSTLWKAAWKELWLDLEGDIYGAQLGVRVYAWGRGRPQPPSTSIPKYLRPEMNTGPVSIPVKKGRLLTILGGIYGHLIVVLAGGLFSAVFAISIPSFRMRHLEGLWESDNEEILPPIPPATADMTDAELLARVRRKKELKQKREEVLESCLGKRKERLARLGGRIEVLRSRVKAAQGLDTEWILAVQLMALEQRRDELEAGLQEFESRWKEETSRLQIEDPERVALRTRKAYAQLRKMTQKQEKVVRSKCDIGVRDDILDLRNALEKLGFHRRMEAERQQGRMRHLREIRRMGELLHETLVQLRDHCLPTETSRREALLRRIGELQGKIEEGEEIFQLQYGQHSIDTAPQLTADELRVLRGVKCSLVESLRTRAVEVFHDRRKELRDMLEALWASWVHRRMAGVAAAVCIIGVCVRKRNHVRAAYLLAGAKNPRRKRGPHLRAQYAKVFDSVAIQSRESLVAEDEVIELIRLIVPHISTEGIHDLLAPCNTVKATPVFLSEGSIGVGSPILSLGKKLPTVSSLEVSKNYFFRSAKTEEDEVATLPLTPMSSSGVSPGASPERGLHVSSSSSPASSPSLSPCASPLAFIASDSLETRLTRPVWLSSASVATHPVRCMRFDDFVAALDAAYWTRSLMIPIPLQLSLVSKEMVEAVLSKYSKHARFVAGQMKERRALLDELHRARQLRRTLKQAQHDIEQKYVNMLDSSCFTPRTPTMEVTFMGETVFDGMREGDLAALYDDAVEKAKAAAVRLDEWDRMHRRNTRIRMLSLVELRILRAAKTSSHKKCTSQCEQDKGDDAHLKGGTTLSFTSSAADLIGKVGQQLEMLQQLEDLCKDPRNTPREVTHMVSDLRYLEAFSPLLLDLKGATPHESLQALTPSPPPRPASGVIPPSPPRPISAISPSAGSLADDELQVLSRLLFRRRHLVTMHPANMAVVVTVLAAVSIVYNNVARRRRVNHQQMRVNIRRAARPGDDPPPRTPTPRHPPPILIPTALLYATGTLPVPPTEDPP